MKHFEVACKCGYARFMRMTPLSLGEGRGKMHRSVPDLFPFLFHRLTPCIFRRSELKPRGPLWLSREWHEAEWCDGKSMTISLSTAAAKERFKEHYAACKSTVLLSGSISNASLPRTNTRKTMHLVSPLLTVAETHCRSRSAESNKNSSACVCVFTCSQALCCLRREQQRQ